MLNDIYTALKTPLIAIENVDDCQWFNMQYEQKGWPYTTGVFVEFPDALNFEFISRQAREAILKVRIHVYSKDVQTTQGIADATVVAHETIATAVKTALERFTPQKDLVNLTKPLLFSGWRHWHRFKDWMVTYVEFDTKMII